MALKALSAIALLLATTTANALTIDPQAPCASPAPDPYGALLNVRSGPGSQFPIVNQLRPGDIVAMLPELPATGSILPSTKAMDGPSGRTCRSWHVRRLHLR